MSIYFRITRTRNFHFTSIFAIFSDGTSFQGLAVQLVIPKKLTFNSFIFATIRAKKECTALVF